MACRSSDTERGTSRPWPTSLVRAGGRPTLLKHIEGRSADLIVTPDGRIVPGNGLMMALHGIGNVSRTQIVQEAPDHLIVRVVQEDPKAGIDSRTIIQNLRTCVGERVRIEVESVESIDDHGRPKLRWVVSKIPNGYSANAVLHS